MNIYVGNLSFKTTEDELRELFGQYGTVDKVSLIRDKDTKRLRGFGFVEMPDDSEAKDAIHDLHEREFAGRELTVNEARPREATSGKPKRAHARSY